MSIRIGADVGGTFTDIVIEVADGSYLDQGAHHARRPRSRDPRRYRPHRRTGEHRPARRHPDHPRNDARHERLIERRGAKTALVTTDGFRDVIETRTESRFEQYDLNIVLPTPLIQRADRHVISERLNARGEISCRSMRTVPARSSNTSARRATSRSRSASSTLRQPTNELRFQELLLAEPRCSIDLK